MSEGFQTLGEAALERAVARFLKRQGEHALDFRDYFTRQNATLVRLSWGVASRVLKKVGTPDEIARLAVDRLREVLSTGDAALSDWFSRNDAFLVSLARGIAKDASAHLFATLLGTEEDPDLWSPKERTEANLRAIEILASGKPITDEDRRVLLRYSGSGGLSLDAVADRVPKDWLPMLQGLVHEYYTPTRLCREVARVLRPLLATIDPLGPIQALEPSAGIGRFIHALSGPGFESLRWTAVEYSHVSARMLAAIRPDITVYEGPFEKWAWEETADPNGLVGKLGLVLSNPPYGKRGGTITLDRDPNYREDSSYPYFLRRCQDFVRPGGIGVWLIPYGFLSSKSPRFVELRRKVFLRHHLMAAFRLPSELFPGANLVTDLVFLRARGGELPEILKDDVFLVEGRYYEEFPTHILGTVVGEQDDDELGPPTKRARRGYEIAGTFTALPPFVERIACNTCFVLPVQLLRQAGPKRPKKEDLPLHLQAAVTLGERVAEYLKHYGATSDSESAKKAALLYPELRDALLAWQAAQAEAGSASPYQDRELQKQTQAFPALVSFLSAFENDGQLAQAFLAAPVYQPRYTGSLDDVLGQAQFLSQTRRHFTTEALLSLRRELEAPLLDASALASVLYAAGWCQDQDEWLPEADYYTGELWPKYRRAKERATAGDAHAERQATRLYQLIDPPPLAEIHPEPRMPWIPLDVMRPWLSDWTNSDVPALVRENGLLKLAGRSYAEMERAPVPLRASIGYLNHDYNLFVLPYEKLYLEEQQREETASEALDRVRLQYAARALAHFNTWLSTHAEAAESIEAAYGTVFRGYVLPTYEPKDLEIVRWRGPITLRPHQRSAAWRILHNGGGLLALDVGVGKTLTGIAVIARLRQEGRARRILIIVPNSIILKWLKEILRALPDYRVLVIGVEQYVGKSGTLRSRTDTEQERALKYRQFQAGEYDVALVTYSMFARTRLSEETLRRFALSTPALLRELGLRARNRVADFDNAEEEAQTPKPKKKKALASLAAVRKLFGADAVEKATAEELERLRVEASEKLQEQSRQEQERLRVLIERLGDRSERDRAAFALELERWIAEMREGQEQEGGISWEDLQVDLLILDEAQNFKNLWSVEPREGGIPKYLGAIQEGSQRAWNFALRAFEVRERNGGSGVVLLSATPAKNSPLEYFTLLGYVDGDAWTRLGITDPEVFIDRYLRLEMRWVVEPDLSTSYRSVVAGFKNLLEMQDIVFRYAEFRTAEEVGLKLPETAVENRLVPMSPPQRARFQEYAEAYRDALKRATAGTDPKARLAALGFLQRMALVSIHPELDQGPELKIPNAAGDETPDAPPARRRGKAPKPQWTWQNARLVKHMASPKLLEAVRIGTAAQNCGNIYFCDNIAIHYWLKQLLIEAGVDEKRIGVLNAEVAPTPLHRQLIAEKFNGTPPIRGEHGEIEQEGIPPEIDHVIANATAYEGIDLQVRTCQVLHLDLPLEPATLQQRNGRAVRQGNLQAVIKIFYILSERSTDAFRLSLITGKLGWMKDILKSADRETNNPAAQSEMSPEEMMLFLASDDPEAAKAAIAQTRREQEERTLENTRRNAWATLRTIAGRAIALKRLREPAEIAHAHRTIEDGQRALSRIPADVWPWHMLVDLAQRATPMAFVSLPGGKDFTLWEGARFVRRQDDGLQAFEIGRVQTDTAGLRWLGEAAFRGIPLSRVPERLATLLGGALPGEFQAAWPEQEERQDLEAGLGQLLGGLAQGHLEDLGLRFAPDAWRVGLFETRGADILRRLSQVSSSEAFRIPVLVGEQLFLVPPGAELAAQTEQFTRLSVVLPFTDVGWQRFLAAAPASGAKWGELKAVAEAWWGRGFPRGLLPKGEAPVPEEDWVEVAVSGGKQKARALLRGRYFAVTRPVGQGAEADRYVVTHVSSGLSASAMPSVEHARVAMQYLETLPVDWTAASPKYDAQQGTQMGAALRFVRDAKTPPTLQEIAAHTRDA